MNRAPIGRFQLARAGGLAVEGVGQPGAVEAERLHLADQRLLVAVGRAPALDRGIERVERVRQTFHRHIDCALLTHRQSAIALLRYPKTPAAANV